jgi:hypothetical protein
MQDFVVRIERRSQLWHTWWKQGTVGSRELRSLTPTTGAIRELTLVFVFRTVCNANGLFGRNLARGIKLMAPIMRESF